MAERPGVWELEGGVKGVEPQVLTFCRLRFCYRLYRCVAEDVEAAAEAASAAFPAWARTPAAERAARLHQPADTVKARREELAAIDVGDEMLAPPTTKERASRWVSWTRSCIAWRRLRSPPAISPDADLRFAALARAAGWAAAAPTVPNCCGGRRRPLAVATARLGARPDAACTQACLLLRSADRHSGETIGLQFWRRGFLEVPM